MAIRGNHHLIAVLFACIAISSCHHQKEVLNGDFSKDSTVVRETLPALASIGPNTFGAEAEVLTVTKKTDSLSGKEYYKAYILVRAITGRGSSLIEIVVPGDTINCVWPGYHANDKELADNIANRKLLKALIEERISREGGTDYTIQSYRFK